MNRLARLFLLCTMLFLSGVLLLGRQSAAPALAETNVAPDLIIESITVSPPNPGPGTTGDITIRVKNIGDGPTSGLMRVYLYIDPAEAPPTQNTPYLQRWGYGLTLLPGGTFEVSRTGHPFTGANPKLYAWIDPPWENGVAESNEANNFYPPLGDAYEDDNECGKAKAITTDGVAQRHDLRPDPATDVDWVIFTGNSGKRYRIEAVAAGDAELELELHDTCNDPPTFGVGAVITFTAPETGDYYVKVNHSGAAAVTDSNYDLKVTQLTSASCTSADEFNDICSTAGEMPINSRQEQIFCKPNDVDWTRFPVDAGGVYQINILNGPNTNVEANLHQSCNLPASTDIGQSFVVTPATGGFLYLETLNSDPNGINGVYTVEINRLKEGCGADSFEVDNNADSAKVITVDGPAQNRNICPPGDQDWVKFSAVAGVTYTLETLNSGLTGDTVLCLRTPDGAYTQCDDDAGPGKGSRLVWTPTASGDYFVSVTDHDPAVAGPDTAYALRVRTRLCDEDGGEPDSTRGGARPIAADGALHDRNICPAGDEDWFSFNAVAGTTYTLETLNNGPEADTIITLLDSNGVVLAENDDHSPGVESQLVYAITQGGTYYAKVRLYNPTKYGSGTEYQFRLRPQTPDPTPTLPPVTPTPVPTLPPVTPTPQPSEVKTLILVNRSQIAEVAGEAATDAMLGKLGELASHAEVQGQILRLDQNDEVRAAYAEWNKAENQTNVLKANAVTAAIRQVILSQLAAKASIKFVVLVGDDRALPFRRIYDNTPYTAENTYPGIDANTPIGAALRANYFLSDDYYVARTPIPFNGRELYLPDVAIGRLVETPNDIMQSVNRFLAGNGVTPINGVLITGWDFVQDQAQADCDDWRRDFNPSAVNCDLIGDSWSAAQLRSLQVSTNPLFNVQMIAGHANHTSEGTPNRGSVTAQEIAGSAVDWNGGLIYTPACHAGLNLPFTQSANPLDLTQAFVGRGANYVANTGYGWGLRGAIGLSEKIMHFYTKALLQGGESQLGPALVTAKTRYYQSNTTLTGFDEKVLQQVILYGLPMQKLQSGSALSDDVEFPGVEVKANEALSGEDLTVSGQRMNFAGGTTWELHTTDNGNYYSLDGHTSGIPDEPLQALHYSKLDNRDVRGAVIISGSFSTTADFTPLLATADNEYVELPATNNGATGWQPATPLNLQLRSQDAYLVTQLGQYNGAERLLRRFNGLEVQLYASTSNDRQPPQLTVVDGVYLPTTGEVAVKVGAYDASGIYEVVVAYSLGDRQSDGAIRSIKLSYDAQAQKWHGRFPGAERSRFTVQVVDKAGNVAVANNKGADYQPARSIFEPPTTIARKLYLPMILR
jgi:hypothetical protein